MLLFENANVSLSDFSLVTELEFNLDFIGCMADKGIEFIFHAKGVQ